MSRLTTTAIDNLGKRLARPKTGVIQPADLDLLASVHREWADALLEARRVVDAITSGLPVRLGVTQRLKTISTTVEKLRRSKTRLSAMQDIVGIRLVGALRLRGQDALVAALCDGLPDAAVDDLRAKPRHGYRAVHVIPRFGRRAVEIQVRTEFQHAWANANEQLADRWGRGIRYGEPPEGDTDAQARERARALPEWQAAADAIWHFERAMDTHEPTAVSTMQEAVDLVAASEQGSAPLVRAFAHLPEELRLVLASELAKLAGGPVP